jgi:hypothetical protein
MNEYTELAPLRPIRLPFYYGWVNICDFRKQLPLESQSRFSSVLLPTAVSVNRFDGFELRITTPT